MKERKKKERRKEGRKEGDRGETPPHPKQQGGLGDGASDQVAERNVDVLGLAAQAEGDALENLGGLRGDRRQEKGQHACTQEGRA